MSGLKNIVYLATAEIAVPVLDALADTPEFTLSAVCTQPDRPAGRKRRLTASPVKARALERGVPVLTPEKVGDAAEDLMEYEPDVYVVFAYGQYLPARVFDAPPHGAINLHPSLLPEYRGAGPIQHALADGRRWTGLSVIRVARKMDAGDILLQRRVEIQPEDTAISLRRRFAALSCEMVLEGLRAMRDGRGEWRVQDESAATECRKLRKEDGRVDWALPARMLHNRVRAYQPWPGMFFFLGDAGMVKVAASSVEPGSGTPGEVLDTGGEGPLIACGEDALRLLEVQPPGKKVMSGRDFLNGHPLRVGEVL